MPTLPIIAIADDHLTVLDTEAFWRSRAYEALMDWCVDHSIDPHGIPASSTIYVDRDTNVIIYERVLIEDGRRVMSPTGGMVTETCRYQPEKPIAPWPAALLNLQAAHTTPSVREQLADAWDAGVLAAFAGMVTRQNAHDVKLTNPHRTPEETSDLALQQLRDRLTNPTQEDTRP